MNQVDAQLKGFPWTPFKEIPAIFRKLYDIELAMNPLAYKVVMETNTYDMCCEYWFNNQLLKVAGFVKEEEAGWPQN